jgi:hypothetical protein
VCGLRGRSRTSICVDLWSICDRLEVDCNPVEDRTLSMRKQERTLFYLANEYLAAASWECDVATRQDLVMHGIACLETLLTTKLDPEHESIVRLKLAEQLVLETDSKDYAFDVVSKGMLLSTHYPSVRYRLELLSIRLLHDTNNYKAAMSKLDNCQQSVRSALLNNVPVLDVDIALAFLKLELVRDDSRVQDVLSYLENLEGQPEVRCAALIIDLYRKLAAFKLREAEGLIEKLTTYMEIVQRQGYLDIMYRAGVLMSAICQGLPRKIIADRCQALFSNARQIPGLEKYASIDIRGYGPLKLNWSDLMLCHTQAAFLGAITFLQTGQLSQAQQLLQSCADAEAAGMLQTSKLLLIKELAGLCLVFPSLYRCDVEQAHRLMVKYGSCCHESLEPLAVYIEGMYHQSLGLLENSRNDFASLFTDSANDVDAVYKRELTWMATFHFCLSSGFDQTDELVRNGLCDLENAIKLSNNRTFQTGWDLVYAVFYTPDREKAEILRRLIIHIKEDHNSYLTPAICCLAATINIGERSDPSKVASYAQLGVKAAQKWNSDLWEYLNGRVLENLYGDLREESQRDLWRQNNSQVRSRLVERYSPAT